jgi:hypothetical protein
MVWYALLRSEEAKGCSEQHTAAAPIAAPPWNPPTRQVQTVQNDDIDGEDDHERYHQYHSSPAHETEPDWGLVYDRAADLLLPVPSTAKIPARAALNMATSPMVS